MNFDDEINEIITTDNESVNKVLRNYASSLLGRNMYNLGNVVGRQIRDYYTAGKIMYNNYKEMLGDNGTLGRDNYYHRKALCEVGQIGGSVANAAWNLAQIKEIKDDFDKRQSHDLYTRAFDSTKDMMNNLDGLRLGIENPDVPCRELLKGFDSKNNRWK